MRSREPSVWDVGVSDLVAAGTTAALVIGMTILALHASRLAHRANAPIIDPGMGIPVRVQPVLDVFPRAAGTTTRPPRWRTKRAARPGREHVADGESASLRTDRRRSATTPAGPEHGEDPAQPDQVLEQDVTPDDPNAVDGEPTSTPQGAGGRIVAIYRQRLVAWLATKFRVRGSGLSPAELERHRVQAIIVVDDQGTIVEYEVLPGAHPEFEIAAYATLEGLRGEQVPRPPDQYPGPVQHRIRVTFKCKRDTCS